MYKKNTEYFLNTFHTFVENMKHLLAIKKNLNRNIPRVKLQTINNVCKYKTLSRQMPRIIKSEILKHNQIKIIRQESHIQEKPETVSEINNLPGNKI